MVNITTGIIQIVWIPIRLTGIIFGYISDHIELSHLKICDFVEIIRK